jgi:hypothetical protein
MFDCLCCCVIYFCLQECAPPKPLGSSPTTTAPISSTTKATTAAATAAASAAARALAANIGKTVVLMVNGMCEKWAIVGCVPDKGLYKLDLIVVTYTFTRL